MNYALYAIAAVEVTGLLLRIARLGKARIPDTPGSAAVGVVIVGVIVAVLVLAALRLS